MSKYLSPKLETVTPYTPGEQPQDQQYIKLNTNESPYRPSPAVVAAVSEAEVEKLRLYSDPACAELLRASFCRRVRISASISAIWSLVSPESHTSVAILFKSAAMRI